MSKRIIFFSVFFLFFLSSVSLAQSYTQKDWLMRLQTGLTISRLGSQYTQLNDIFKLAGYDEIKSKAYPLATVGVELNYKRMGLLAEGQLEIPTRMGAIGYSGYRLNLLGSVQVVRFSGLGLNFDWAFFGGISYNLHQITVHKNNYIATFDESLAAQYNNATTYLIKGICSDFSVQTRYQSSRIDIAVRMGFRFSPARPWHIDDYVLPNAPQDPMNYAYASFILTPFKGSLLSK